MTTNVDHVIFESTAEDAVDYRRHLILVVSGTASPQIAERLSTEIGTDYIGGTTILQDLKEGSNKAEKLAHAAFKVSSHTGIAILTLPNIMFPLRQFREAVPKDVDVRFILCGEEADSTMDLEEQGDRDGLKCLKVDVDRDGIEAVVRRIESDVWGTGSGL